MPLTPRKVLPSQEDLHKYLEYRDGRLFRRLTGDPADKSLSKYNYRLLYFGGEVYLAHRAIFKMFYGYVPDILDHIDRNRMNNRVENLREATGSLNALNRGLSIKNTSGYKNILWEEGRRRYSILYKKVRLGGYKQLSEALKYRDYFLALSEHDKEIAIKKKKSEPRKFHISTSPTRHIYWDKSRGKYCVDIAGWGYVGRYVTLEEAIILRDSVLSLWENL